MLRQVRRVKTKKRDQYPISCPSVGVIRGQENRKGVRPRLEKGNAEEVWAGHLEQERLFEEVALEGGPSCLRRNSPRKAVGCGGVGLPGGRRRGEPHPGLFSKHNLQSPLSAFPLGN